MNIENLMIVRNSFIAVKNNMRCKTFVITSEMFKEVKNCFYY